MEIQLCLFNKTSIEVVAGRHEKSEGVNFSFIECLKAQFREVVERPNLYRRRLETALIMDQDYRFLPMYVSRLVVWNPKVEVYATLSRKYFGKLFLSGNILHDNKRDEINWPNFHPGDFKPPLLSMDFTTR